MTSKEEHDVGLKDRIEQIWDKEGPRLLSIIPNVDYFDGTKNIIGEIDILKLYQDGSISIEEIKATHSDKNEEKAKEQLQRAKFMFRNYTTSVYSYFANKRKLIEYNVYMEEMKRRIPYDHR